MWLGDNALLKFNNGIRLKQIEMKMRNFVYHKQETQMSKLILSRKKWYISVKMNVLSVLPIQKTSNCWIYPTHHKDLKLI